MTMTFSGFVSVVANGFRAAKHVSDWLTNAPLKRDFLKYLSMLERRRVLYHSWEYENFHGVVASLEEILDETRQLRAAHPKDGEVRKILGSLITHLQNGLDCIRGCNQQSEEGEFMAYKALLKLRSELAQVLAIFCGKLNVDPKSTELEQFIMNMALVRPKA